MISLEKKDFLTRSAVTVTLLFPATFVGFPLLWMVFSSLVSAKDLYSGNLIPTGLTLVNYQQLFSQTYFGQQFFNSVVVAVTATLLCLVTASLAGYSLSRFRQRWNFEKILLIIYTIPPIMMVIPILLVFTRLGLTNTYWGLALAHSTFMLPFAAMILAAYFNNIPTTLDEAAMVDGTGRMGALFRIVIPLALPGIAATGVIIFANSWNDYLFAFILMSTREMQTLPVGVAELSEGQTLQWGMLMASAVMITAPMLLFFFLIQKRLLSGFIFAVTGEK